MSENFRLEILTPSKVILDQEVSAAEFQTSRGLMEVRSGHASLVAVLEIGQVRLEFPSGPGYAVAVHGGILKIEDDTVLVLASEGEHPENIDLERSKEALERAKAALAAGAGAASDHEKIEPDEVQTLIRARLRAEARIESFQSYKDVN